MSGMKGFYVSAIGVTKGHHDPRVVCCECQKFHIMFQSLKLKCEVRPNHNEICVIAVIIICFCYLSRILVVIRL